MFGEGYHLNSNVKISFKASYINKDKSFFVIEEELKWYYFIYTKYSKGLYHGVYLAATRLKNLESKLKPDFAERVGKSKGMFDLIKLDIHDLVYRFQKRVCKNTSDPPEACSVAQFNNDKGNTFCLVRMDSDDSIEKFMKDFQKEVSKTEVEEDLYVSKKVKSSNFGAYYGDGSYRVNTNIMTHLGGKYSQYLEDDYADLEYY